MKAGTGFYSERAYVPPTMWLNNLITCSLSQALLLQHVSFFNIHIKCIRRMPLRCSGGNSPLELFFLNAPLII